MVFCYVGQTSNAKMFLNCELGCYGVALSSLFWCTTFWCMLCACDWLNLHVCMSVCGCVCIHVNIIYNSNKLECQWFLLCKHHDKFSAFYETEFWYQTLDKNVCSDEAWRIFLLSSFMTYAHRYCHAWFKLTDASQTFPATMKSSLVFGHLKMEWYSIVLETVTVYIIRYWRLRRWYYLEQKSILTQVNS